MNLPYKKRGESVHASDWNALVDAVNRSRVAGVAGGGMELKHSPGGVVLRAHQAALAADFKTTSSITKRSGATLGTGTGTLQTIVAGAYVDTGQTFALVSKWTDKAVNSGAYVTASYVDGNWEVIDVDDCANLT